MADTNVNLVGNLTRDPEIRFLDSGTAVADFGMAVANRVKNGDEWEDGPGQFFDITAWGTLAENVADSLTKGDRVVVVGVLKFDSWENDEGETRNKVKITADAVGPELRWATASPTRNEKGGSGGSSKPPTKPTPRKAKPSDGIDDPF